MGVRWRFAAAVARAMVVAMLVSGIAGTAVFGAEPPGKPPIAQLYEKAKRASVEVLVDGHLEGSGWFADPAGVIFTAGHMIDHPGQRIEVLSPVAGRLPAKAVAADLGHDLAIISVAPREGGYPALALAAKVPPPGEEVYLLGAPLFRHTTLVRGMVARDETSFEYCDGHYVEILHVAATVPAGMSGGPWMNGRGEVVGLQSGTMSVNDIPVGIVDISLLEAIRGLLKNRQTAATPTLGAAIEEPWQQDRAYRDRFPPGTEGLVVKILEKDGPAARAGLKQGELIVAVDGGKVRVFEEVLTTVLAKQPGQSVELTILNPGGKGQRKATVRLGKVEAAWDRAGAKK